MGFKEGLEREKHALASKKRPYESAAFLIFAILMLQQLFFLLRNIYRFIKNGGTFSTANITVVNNLQGFFSRIVFIDSSKWIYVIGAILALVLYYFLIYLLVWNYCKKRGHAKWTWTLLIVFGPNIFFMPPYIFYAVYVFRSYFYRFFKTLVEEYKAFDPKELAAMEASLAKQEDEEAAERDTLRAEKAKAKEEAKAEKAQAKEEEIKEKVEEETEE